jgi:hypothetical protein
MRLILWLKNNQGETRPVCTQSARHWVCCIPRFLPGRGTALMLSESTLKILEVAGTWVSGIGTLLAVVVSLHLARRQTAVKLDLRAGHRLVVTLGEKQIPEYISIQIVNVGQQPTTITSVGWTIGFFRKSHFVQRVDGDPMSDQIPKELATGKQAKFFVPLDQEPNWIERFAANLDARFPAISVRTLRIWVSTTVGKTVFSKPERSLQKMLVEARGKLPKQS